MPHLHRFYIASELSAETELLLGGDEAHHALHVIRVRKGDEVALINGRGQEALGAVIETTRHDVRIACAKVEATVPAARNITIVQAALHNAKATEFLVRHGTELGIARFLFFRAKHSERHPASVEKLERTAIEAMKQSGRRWLPSLESINDLGAALDAAPGTRLIAALDTQPQPLATSLGGGDVSIFIGPEGDFAAEEVELAMQAGAIPISLGGYTLRSEVAGVIAAALVQYEWGQLGSR